MNAWIFCATILCDPCGRRVRKWLTESGKAPADPDNESTYDSDDFPKGPYPAGGGEADHPQHCGICSQFLENPLTPEGVAYVRDYLAQCPEPHHPDSVANTWRKFYGELVA